MFQDLFLLVPTGILFDDRVVYFSVAIYSPAHLPNQFKKATGFAPSFKRTETEEKLKSRKHVIYVSI